MPERLDARHEELMEQGFSPPYASDIVYLDERENRARTGKIVVKPSDREWFEDRMTGPALFYLDRHYEDTATRDWWVFVHDIPSETGSHRHQGGLAIFVLEGHGATIMDGERFEWEEGDLLLLPIKRGEIEHHHIAYTEQTRWIAFIYVPVLEAVGSQMVQLTDRPQWAAKDYRSQDATR